MIFEVNIPSNFTLGRITPDRIYRQIIQWIVSALLRFNGKNAGEFSLRPLPLLLQILRFLVLLGPVCLLVDLGLGEGVNVGEVTQLLLIQL